MTTTLSYSLMHNGALFQLQMNDSGHWSLARSLLADQPCSEDTVNVVLSLALPPGSPYKDARSFLLAPQVNLTSWLGAFTGPYIVDTVTIPDEQMDLSQLYLHIGLSLAYDGTYDGTVGLLYVLADRLSQLTTVNPVPGYHGVSLSEEDPSRSGRFCACNDCAVNATCVVNGTEKACACVACYGGSGQFRVLAVRSGSLTPHRIALRALLSLADLAATDAAQTRFRFTVTPTSSAGVVGLPSNGTLALGS